MPRFFATATILTVTGCASVTGSKLQSISILSMQDSKEVAGAGCTLSNDAGKWVVTTPGSVTVAKSTGDLSIECKKEAGATGIVGQATVPSKANTSVWGNLLLGGPAGYVIDRQTGAGFDYPPSITVLLNQSLDALISPPAAKKAAAVSALPSPLPSPVPVPAPVPLAIKPAQSMPVVSTPVVEPAQTLPVAPPPAVKAVQTLPVVTPATPPAFNKPAQAMAAAAPSPGSNPDTTRPMALAPPANLTFEVPAQKPAAPIARRKKADSYWE